VAAVTPAAAEATVAAAVTTKPNRLRKLQSRAEDQSSALFSCAIAAAVVIALALFVVIPTGNLLFLSQRESAFPLAFGPLSFHSDPE
jgi:hypothetical protein